MALPALAEDTLRVTNWAEYIGEETIANFENSFGNYEECMFDREIYFKSEPSHLKIGDKNALLAFLDLLVVKETRTNDPTSQFNR